jgi:hypothetical protein
LSPIDLPLEAMSPEEARQLALAWLGEGQPDASVQADAIARESQGSPFFVDEFVRYLRLMRRSSVDGASLDEVLRTRITRLPDEARRVLQVAAVAGYPIAQSLAVRAAGVGHGGATTLGILRADHMIRTNGTRSEDTLVTYHDRIRTAVVSSLPAEERQTIHRRIAELLQTRTGLDAEALTHHLTNAGQPEAAAIHAVKAGDRASDHLQFDRAVHFYRMALELGRHEKTDELAIRRKLADALANAGLGAASAEEYLRAAAGLTGAERGRLRLRAAEQLIRCGHSGRGLDTIGEYFREIGVSLPRRRSTVLLGLLYQRFRVWLSRYRGRREPLEAPDVCQLIDVFYSLGFALSFSDTMRGISFQARGLRLALDIGEPHRISRGMAAEALLAGSRGGNSDRTAYVDRMLGARARLGIEQEDDPLLGGYVLGASCGVAYLNGRWRRSLELADQAEELLRERCTGVWWELAQLQVVAISCLYWMGDVHEVCRRTFSCLQDARAKGDLFKASSVRGALSNFAWLALDEAAEARRHAEQARAEWGEEFDLQHSFNVFAQGQIDLYEGRGGAALERVRASWSRTRRALLLALQMNYLNLLHLRARAALMEAAAGSRPDPGLLASARRDARRIRRTGMAWASPLAHLVEAGIAAASGQPEGALAALGLAESELVAEDMNLYAAVARLRRGELLGGDEGARQAAAALEELRVRGVADPERVALMCAPGFGR